MSSSAEQAEALLKKMSIADMRALMVKEVRSTRAMLRSASA